MGNNSGLALADLKVSIDGKEIIKGVDLRVREGELHVIMGPNGSGKSTLSNAVMGHPKYKVTGGEAVLDGRNLLEMPVNERAKAGLFLGFQYPFECAGVGFANFLRTSYNAVHSHDGAPVSDPRQARSNVLEFHNDFKQKLKNLGMPEDFAKRSLNEGFSGGEKKRAEVLQMVVLKPRIAFLDEPDSGLDVDALRTVAGAINSFKATGAGIVVITHYKRILDYLNPDYVHVMLDGRIVKSGSHELAHEIESKGYDWIKKELELPLAAK